MYITSIRVQSRNIAEYYAKALEEETGMVFEVYVDAFTSSKEVRLKTEEPPNLPLRKFFASYGFDIIVNEK